MLSWAETGGEEESEEEVNETEIAASGIAEEVMERCISPVEHGFWIVSAG